MSGDLNLQINNQYRSSAPKRLTHCGQSSTHLAFLIQPNGTLIGTNFSAKIGLVDYNGQVITSDSSTVIHLTKSSTPSGTLTGTLTATLSSGTASFSNLQIDTAGDNFTLVASASGGAYSSVTSQPFSLSGTGGGTGVYSASYRNGFVSCDPSMQSFTTTGASSLYDGSVGDLATVIGTLTSAFATTAAKIVIDGSPPTIAAVAISAKSGEAVIQSNFGLYHSTDGITWTSVQNEAISGNFSRNDTAKVALNPHVSAAPYWSVCIGGSGGHGGEQGAVISDFRLFDDSGNLISGH